jgi:type VI secretion system protein ImpA
LSDPEGLAVSQSDQPNKNVAAGMAAEAVESTHQPTLDAAIAVLCAPISESDPCGPDLDSENDTEYLNFFAQVNGILPTSFFSLEDGKPFDPSTIDIKGQLEAIKPLLARSRDIRLLMVQARLLILNKDLAGFAVNVAAVAQLLEKFWDVVHPRPKNGDLDARLAAIAALDLPTVVFPVQYAPLFEGRRTGPFTYRKWLIATGEVKPRAGEADLAASSITKALDEAPPASLEAARKNLGLLNKSLDGIRQAFVDQRSSAGLGSLPALTARMSILVDPYGAVAPGDAATAETEGNGDPLQKRQDGPAAKAAGPSPASIAEAAQALAAIADYYSHSEPSSPTLPLVRQAHQLIGKSFLEVMTILVPSQVEKAAFQIGTDTVFDLPVGTLSTLSQVAPAATQAARDNGESNNPADLGSPEARNYRVESRSQAIALLDLVQRYFRISEPSSPVPMLCERARALAERDFMGVLRDVLPKSALKNINTDR